MWVFARFDKAVRLALTFVGRKELVSSAKAQRELGWTMRPVRESIVDTARTMIEHRIVPRADAPGPSRARRKDVCARNSASSRARRIDRAAGR